MTNFQNRRFTQTFFDTQYVQTVDRTSFVPQPSVDSAIIKLTKKLPACAGRPTQDFEFKKRFEGFLHRGYSNPRKMLNKAFKPEELSKVNISTSLRPQNLSVADWKRLFDSLYN